LSQTALAHLLAGCQAGDAEAIADLVQSYRPALFRLALSILDDPAEADEAAQDAFVAALDSLGRFRGEAAFTTWLYAITVNVCRGRLRRRGVRQRLRRALEALLRLSPGHTPRPEEQALQSEAQAAVWRAVQALPQPQRLVVVLRYYHDLRLAEIAAVLGVTERTVHNRLRAAHARLRARLSDADPKGLQDL
jgi:RNA polymerase sigma-70 factor (ECF subfamily)